MKKFLNRAFVLVFFLLLFGGLVKTVLLPKDINYYENRYANKLPAVTAAGFFDKSLQQGVDDALMDQFPLAQTAKKGFNSLSARLKAALTGAVLPHLAEDTYVNLGGIHVFGGDHYVYTPVLYSQSAEKFESRVRNINDLIAALPETEVYAFYIEKETDLQLDTGEKLLVGDEIFAGIELPETRKAIFRVADFAQFDREFFRTDTHWNHLGAYRGYCEVLSLLLPEAEPLAPGAAQLVCDDFSGNKAATHGAGGIWTEPFYAFAFPFPAMEISINGAAAADYGQQNVFSLDSPTYGQYYGGDEGEVIFRNASGNGRKLLILGESYDNDILKLLASHYSELYSVDLRNFEAKMGEKFNLSAYLEQYGIDSLLLIGNVDYFRSESFDVEVTE